MFKREGHRGDFVDLLTDSEDDGTGEPLASLAALRPSYSPAVALSASGAPALPPYSIPTFGIWIDGKPTSDAGPRPPDGTRLGPAAARLSRGQG